MCKHRHQVHKWTLNRFGREVPSEFLLQHLWMPAERLQKRLMCSLKIAFIFAAVKGRKPGWRHRIPELGGRPFPHYLRRAWCRLFLNSLWLSGSVFKTRISQTHVEKQNLCLKKRLLPCPVCHWQGWDWITRSAESKRYERGYRDYSAHIYPIRKFPFP